MRQDGPLPPSPPAAASADADEATPSNTAGAGALLFLVDDQAGMRSAVQKYLVQSGFRVSAFASAEDALHAMNGAPAPDAVVTDVVMPGGMDGLAFTRTLRADPHLCAVPIVLLTAKGLTPDRIAGYGAGCNAYLPKPFDPDELVAVLKTLTANTKLHRSALLGSEVSALRQEVAEVRQLMRGMLQLQAAQQQQLAGALSAAALRSGGALDGVGTFATDVEGEAQQQEEDEEGKDDDGKDGAKASEAAARRSASASSAAEAAAEAVRAAGGLPQQQQQAFEIGASLHEALEAASAAAAAAAAASAEASSLAIDIGGTSVPRAVEVPLLTRRERSVLELVGDGYLNKEIASTLGVGLRNVEKVVRKLLEKTDTSNRTALVKKSLQLGLISLEPLGPAPASVFVTNPPRPNQQLPPGGTPQRLPPGRVPLPRGQANEAREGRRSA